MMGTIVQAQLYTFSSREAKYRPQKLLQIANWGVFDTLTKSIVKPEMILVWFQSFCCLLELRIIRGDFRDESEVELGKK